jgi:malonyl-CoA/methylmalonyl-CoA synthetase
MHRYGIIRVMQSATDPSVWLDQVLASDPDRPFLSTPGGVRLSYAGLAQRSGALAAALLELGVRAGERVAVQVDKSVDSVLLYVACLRIGAVYVPINTANTVHEVEYFLRDSRPCVAVVRPSERERLRPVAIAAGIGHLETLGSLGEGSLAALAARVPAPLPGSAAFEGGALAAIVYTSGTTGRSKGAMLTRANLASNATTLAAAWEFSARDVLLHALPLFHVHGLFAAINTVLASGSSLLLLAAFDAAQVLNHLPEVSVFMGVPTHYTRLLQLPGLERSACANVRLFVSGSAPLLAETHREFEQRTGHRILERYGMTETLMNTSNPYAGPRVPGTVGPPLPGIEIRIVDPESGHGLPGADATGGIEIRGPNVCAGYWGDPDKTRREFSADGWFRSGDLGRFDRDGYLHIVGRAKDLVISGGYNVYPREVEAELDALPAVLESAVFGVPHPDFGEGVTALVVARPGAAASEAEIIQAVQSRIARYKVPKRILFVAELPRNAMGKVQKSLLREQYASLYQSA